MCRKQWPSEFTLKAFLSNLSFCVLISNGHLISFSSQSFEVADCFCSRLCVLMWLMRETTQNGVTFEWCLFDVLFFGLLVCLFFQPLARLEVVIQTSFSVGWMACASPCAGAVMGTLTAWTWAMRRTVRVSRTCVIQLSSLAAGTPVRNPYFLKCTD